MKQILVLLIVISIVSCKDQPTMNKSLRKKDVSSGLFPIYDKGFWGYIDQNGKIRIKPKFIRVGEFSEGLAAVRINGTYGYIDSLGEFAIEPHYDMAYSFTHGIATVFKDSNEQKIDVYGNVLSNKTNIFGEFNTTIIKTKDGKYGLINKKKALVLDTIFTRINQFYNGLATVIVDGMSSEQKGNDSGNRSKEGVINRRGRFVIPLGMITGISLINSGCAKGRLSGTNPLDSNALYAVIDTFGKVKFHIPIKKWNFVDETTKFSEGLAAIQIYPNDSNSMDEVLFNDWRWYLGVINKEGKILFRHSNWINISPFKQNRAFVENLKGDWYLINRRGQFLNDKPFKNVLFDIKKDDPQLLFKNGWQLVQNEIGWGPIDSTGEFILDPCKELKNCNLSRKGDLVFIKKYVENQSRQNSYIHGFWNMHTGVKVSPVFQYLGVIKNQANILYAVHDSRIGYIDLEGNYIWKEDSTDGNETIKYNIDYMTRGSFYASSPFKEELNGAGGWGKSKNGFEEISNADHFEKGQLNMFVNVEEKHRYQGLYEGVKMYVANTDADTFFFKAQDSRLYLNLQALNKQGEWKDIEYLPSSWCGNSYHALFLPPDHQWEFVLPNYNGEFKTKLRAKLLYKYKNTYETSILYSNEFEGGINPGQFWRKQSYTPSSIMDSYLD